MNTNPQGKFGVSIIFFVFGSAVRYKEIFLDPTTPRIKWVGQKAGGDRFKIVEFLNFSDLATSIICKNET